MLLEFFQHIESRLRISLPEDLAGSLQDGVVLCHIANHVRPRAVPSIHVPSPAVVSVYSSSYSFQCIYRLTISTAQAEFGQVQTERGELFASLQKDRSQRGKELTLI